MSVGMSDDVLESMEWRVGDKVKGERQGEKEQVWESEERKEGKNQWPTIALLSDEFFFPSSLTSHHISSRRLNVYGFKAMCSIYNTFTSFLLLSLIPSTSYPILHNIHSLCLYRLIGSTCSPINLSTFINVTLIGFAVTIFELILPQFYEKGVLYHTEWHVQKLSYMPGMSAMTSTQGSRIRCYLQPL